MKRLLVLLALVLPLTASADDLERTLMLVATPDLEGPYRHTALIVIPAGEDRHLGFILNRASQMRLASTSLYYGGPEMMSNVFAMLRKDPGPPSLHLFGDVFITGDPQAVDRLVEEAQPGARFFAGFVGWESGQLADELAQGYWYVAEPDAAQVFNEQPGESVWSELVKRVSRRLQTRLE